jgi:hypothetical protein
MADSVTVTPTPPVAPPVTPPAPPVVVQPTPWWHSLVGPAVMLVGFIAYEHFRDGGNDGPTPAAVTVSAAEAKPFKQDILNAYGDAYIKAAQECRGAAKLSDVMAHVQQNASSAIKTAGAARFSPTLARIIPEGSEPTPGQMMILGDFYESLGSRIKQKGWFGQ